MVDDEMGRRVDVISSKGCSKLFTNDVSLTTNSSASSSSSFSFRGIRSLEHASPATDRVQTKGPFSGLVICVTGLSKEARKQVMEATQRLGGEYSAHLHPKCTHLVVQSFHGPKFEHALKHGSKNGLFVVTLGWFVDSVRRNVRLSESLYSIRFVGGLGSPMDDLNQLVQKVDIQKNCLPVGSHDSANQCVMIEERFLHFSEREPKRKTLSSFHGFSFYVDELVSAEMKNKVIEAVSAGGAILLDKWFVGCSATHVVCEGSSVQKYLGHTGTIVTPLWVLKTVKERRLQRLVHLSADLARQTGTLVETLQNGIHRPEVNENTRVQDAPSAIKLSYEVRQKIAHQAKDGVRLRRHRHMQTCQTPIRPITPASLLDSICWSVSEPTSTASIYTDSSSVEDANEQHTSAIFAANREGKELENSFINMTRPLTESEKSELILKSHFLTVLFPVDRFSEMGPLSRTYFSDKGFTRLQILEHIHAFYQVVLFLMYTWSRSLKTLHLNSVYTFNRKYIYSSIPETMIPLQENMSAEEIEIAIHSDSRHADRLRSIYSSKELTQHGYVELKRVDFMGSRRSFEMLKRVVGDNNSNVYELLIRA